MSKSIFLGNTAIQPPEEKISFSEITRDGESFYKIENINTMRPFFMSIVSNSNHWMFISSNGALTAGRRNSDQALFPYYTDDKITESGEHTGCKTIFLVTTLDKRFLWEPFSDLQTGIYNTQRNLYKNAYGNKVLFEEINCDLNLVFTYEWNSSNRFGFVRTATLKNIANTSVKIEVLDGLQNILPYGVGEDLQKQSSNLVDAYKKSELKTSTGVGIYSLSAIIVDRAEPSEALKANIVWSTGLNNAKKLISSTQISAFKKGEEINEEVDIRAKRGAYLLVSAFDLNAEEKKSWRIIADVNKNITELVALEDVLSDKNIDAILDEDIEQGAEELLRLVGAADGLQLTNDRRGNHRHFANTMFNIMRGGIFDYNYIIEKNDFLPYIKKANNIVFKAKEDMLKGLDNTFDLKRLLDLATTNDDADFSRLCLEYLPLKFSRRHGDPSRPWNKFSINTKNEIDGSKVLDYQGNWRDIFQNWEALAHSYPQFIQGMIHKFLNATTFDGYNPYRITKDGFDWETVEPDNPWAYIGYWGDHQIIYLLKFLEFIEDYYPGKLNAFYAKECFVYANVPYKIKPYSSILEDPKNTIIFDHEADALIREKRKVLGADGALLNAPNNGVYKVNFIEKTLATLLAKLSNFVPEAGIWLNTQRPEWNDANNALVGNGVSMVTLYYLRRFLAFFQQNVKKSSSDSYLISKELSAFFSDIKNTLDKHTSLIDQNISDRQRKEVMDALGEAATQYREAIYTNGFSGHKEELSNKKLLDFIATSLDHLEDAIRKNKKTDGLYHAYNLISISKNEVSVDYLPEMLEGQVAILSASYLDANESLAVLNALRKSALYREDQHSYILYPNKTLPLFVNRNTIPATAVKHSKLCQTLLNDGNFQILSKDLKGEYHFNGNFKNAEDLKAALNALPEQYQELVLEDTNHLLDSFEAVFNHKAFTGRSGTFYGYEGLGSIYWHMVSKLALAAYEVADDAVNKKESPETIEALKQHYYEIVKGIGAHKSPTNYGAFPSDPYSHTPAGKGAQQPGMTGQVKEDILSRFGELGLRVKEGVLHFDFSLLKENEYLETPHNFNYFNVCGEKKTIALSPQSLAFTYCQVPLIYCKAKTKEVVVSYVDGKQKRFDELHLDQSTTQDLFNREHRIEQVEVRLNN